MKGIGQNLRDYIAVLYQAVGLRLFYAVLLLILSGITEGIGLVLLVPFLNAALAGPKISQSLPAFPSLLSWVKTPYLSLSMGGLLLAGLALIIFRALLSRQREMTMASLRLDCMQQLQISLFQAAEAASWGHWVRQRSSSFLHVLMSEVPALGEGTYYFLHLCVTLVLTLVYVLVALQISFLLTACAVMTAAVLFWLLRGYLQEAYVQGQAIDQASDSLYEQISNFFSGLKFTKSHGEAHRFTQTLIQSVAQFYTERLNFVRSYQKLRAVMEISIAAGLCSFVYVAVTWLHLAAVQVMLLILIFARLMPMMSRIFSEAQHVWHMLPAVGAVLKALETSGSMLPPNHEAQAGTFSLCEGVRFQRVSVRYETNNEPALTDVDCMVPARQTTALIGPSGAGKTTFVDLLTGLLQPDSGQILVDGKPLHRINPAAWGKRISYLPQEGFLFYGSIRDNLAYLAPGKSDQELWTALRLAAADAFVRGLPAGLDAVIGDQGITLSGGERQRLSLARALLREPDLLIMDEATSALDGLSEQYIRATLNNLRGKITIVLIAHRLASVRYADQIIVLNNGRIRGCGGWNDLSGQKYFHDAVAAQSL